MVSPPYIFQNDKVHITYEYIETRDKIDRWYSEILLHDFEEGGAEYLRIINHSNDKPVEFFLAGSLIPKGYTIVPDKLHLPSVRYRKASIYFLLFPEYKFTKNGYIDDEHGLYYFEGDRCGDLILTRAWTVNEVMALYRAEYDRSDSIRLVVDDEDWRMIDMVEGKMRGNEKHFKGKIFYGIIEPEGEFKGDENIWLISTTSGMSFTDYLSFNVPIK